MQEGKSASIQSKGRPYSYMQGLRLHDNPALIEAIKNTDYLYPVFVLDPHFLRPEKIGVNRIRFLLESLADLDESLRSRGSRLIVLEGVPNKIFPEIWRKWNVKKLCFEADTEPYAVKRDEEIKKLAAEADVQVCDPTSHTLYNPDFLIGKNGGKAPLTMKAFESLVMSVGPPSAPIDSPSLIPGPKSGAAYSGDEESQVPCLSMIGYNDQTCDKEDLERKPVVQGGETSALARLAKYLSDKEWVASFEKPKGNPAAFTPYPATTLLSPYLKFGNLSARLFYHKLVEIYKEKKGKHTKPPVSLLGQLLWREFFYCASVYVPNFDKMKGNSICKQIPWETKSEFLKAWEDSATGYPWIDAIMAQLRQEGWMHHLARHSVACFLTRGDLYCSWEDGRDVFDKYLLDADWAINNGNWMWLSASAFFSQYFRVYSPISFGKQYDKNGDYIRKYVPALKDMPAKYIYEPWTAPITVQEKANCIVGRDYPKPIVEHSSISKINMQKMKEAYSANKDDKALPKRQASGTSSRSGKKAK